MPDLEGRRLWFAGIGGAGLSGYAIVARAWGAEVSGWDRNETPYLAHVREAGIPVDGLGRPARAARGARRPSSRPRMPARSEGRSRAEFLAELVALRRSIVVGRRPREDDDRGDDRLRPRPPRRRPLVPDRRRGSAARRQRTRRGAAGSSSRATSPTAPSSRSRPTSPSSRTSTSTTTRPSRRLPSSRSASRRWAAWARRRPRRLGPRRRAGRLRARGAGASTTASTPPARWPRSSSPASSAPRPPRRLRGSAAPAGGSRLTARRAAFASSTTTPTIPPSSRRRSPPPGARRRGRLVVLFQPHLYSRTLHLGRELGAALAAADAAVRHGDLRRHARSPSPGVSGKLVVDGSVEARPGMPVGWAPALRRRRPARRVARSARRCRPDRGRRATSTGPSRSSSDALRRVKENVALQPVHDARDRRPRALVRRAGEPSRSSSTGSRGQPARGSQSPSSASARTCSSPTRAFRAWRSSSAGSSPSAEAVEGRLVAGGGAPLAVCLHRARAAELGGIEFVCAIPGTVGGAVWMNAGAYGGDIAGVLDRALVADAAGTRWLTPEELGLRYRSSGLRHGQVVAPAELRLEPRPLADDQGDGRRDAGQAQGRPSPRTSGRSGASSRTPSTS